MKHLVPVALIGVIIVSFLLLSSGPSTTGNVVHVESHLDAFAECLTEEGAIFYGSFECPHCNTQKGLFGESMHHVKYVECGPLRGPQNSICRTAGVEAYPTWVIDGSKYTGSQSLERLSELTSCELDE